MSSDIEKLAVLDSRIVQSRPKYAVEKGALSLTNAPFNAIAATSSQHTYNIYVPSENVFLDRKVLWSSTVFMKATLNLAAAPVAGDSLIVAGRDLALCALPLNSLCSTLSATINDTTSVINSQDVLKEVLRLADYKRNRICRTAPTQLDKYQNYNDAYGSLNSPINAYNGSTDYDNVNNGAFPGLVFTTDAGAPLGTAAPAFAGAGYNAVNGVPVCADNAQGPFTIYFKWRTTEPICLAPFVFSDEHEWDTGLFGLNNIQLIMNLQADPSRIIRHTQRADRVLTAISYNTNVANQFQESVVNCQFLTPSLSIPLPPKSVVPYMEFPRYITQYSNGTIAPGAVGQIISQTITLPCIPDLFIIYAKPSVVSPNDADWYLPLATSADNIRNPLSINFDNFSGLLSSTSTEQLFAMSHHNGVDMDWATWIGSGVSSGESYGAVGPYTARQQGQKVPLVGSIVVLKPGQDITLQEGQAPSLVGNFTMQFNLQVKNTSDVPQTPQLYVITANSGFFESIRGSSRIIKGVLSEQDIINAPLAPFVVRSELQRMVGGFSFSGLANILSKAKNIYQQTKPLVSEAKKLLPDTGFLGSVKSGLSTVGYGTGGYEEGQGTGAGTGAGTGGRRKKSLASRLM